MRQRTRGKTRKRPIYDALLTPYRRAARASRRVLKEWDKLTAVGEVRFQSPSEPVRRPQAALGPRQRSDMVDRD